MPSNNNSIQNMSFIFDKISRQINFVRRNVEDCVCITLTYVCCEVELKALYLVKQLRDVWHYSEIRYLDGGLGEELNVSTTQPLVHSQFVVRLQTHHTTLSSAVMHSSSCMYFFELVLVYLEFF